VDVEEGQHSIGKNPFVELVASSSVLDEVATYLGRRGQGAERAVPQPSNFDEREESPGDPRLHWIISSHC